MKLTDYSVVCDENIQATVVEFLKTKVKNVRTVSELQLLSAEDEKILETAHLTNSIVITHDSDFGKIVFIKQIPFTGILYLRPGHIAPLFTIETLRTLFENDFELTPPFILVAERTKPDNIKIRIRSL